MAKQKFNIIKSTCIPVNIDNCNTDLIIPARYLASTTRDPKFFGDAFMHDLRFDANGNPIYEQNTVPIVLDATTIGSYFFDVSSNFIEDGSYIRLKHVNLSYSFANMLKKVEGIDDVALSFTATNLFTLTKYTGSDPQINASPGEGGVGSAGIDNYAVPSVRGYNISLKVAF